MKRILLYAALGFALTSGIAKANLITTFDASGTFSDGAVLSGTLTIDTTLGKITSADLSIGAPDASTLTNITGQLDEGSPFFYSATVQNAAGTEDFDFGVPLDSLVAYAGGQICSIATEPGCTRSNLFDVTTGKFGADLSVGELTLPSTTVPEPASLALLGTALAGFGVIRRRKRIPHLVGREFARNHTSVA